MDTEPPGYEPAYNNTSGALPEWVTYLNQYGYADDLRLAFLRERGIDPLDVIGETLRLPFDLNQPFFLYSWQNGSSKEPIDAMREMPKAWISFRGKMNRQAIQPLEAMLSEVSVPTFVMPSSTSEPISPTTARWTIPWSPGTEFPRFEPTASQPPPPNLVEITTFDETSSITALQNVGKLLKTSINPVAVDASSVKIGNLGKLLDLYFPRDLH